MTQYNSGYLDCFPFSDTNVTLLLEASTALPYTVPGSSSVTYRAHFSVSTDADVWVCNNGTAAVPLSNVAASARYQERIDVNFNRYVKGGDILSFISTGTPQVGISLLMIPGMSI
jgi:hypothetical protein